MSKEGNYRNSNKAGNILLACGILGIIITLISGSVVVAGLARISDLESKANYYESNPYERASFTAEHGYDPVDTYRADAQEGRSIIVPLMVVAFLMFIASIVIFAGGLKSKRQESYGFVLFSSIMSFFILSIFCVIPIYFVTKAKEEFSVVNKVRASQKYYQSPPINPIRPDLQPNILKRIETTDKLNILMMSNLSKEEKERQLLKLYLDDKITKEQFYDMKGKL